LAVRAEQLPIKTYTSVDGLAYDVTRRIVADPHGFLWFCTQGALTRFDGYGFRNYGFADGLASPSINDLVITRAGVYWVATNGGGVNRLNVGASPAPRFTQFPVGATPQSNRVNVLFEDAAGILWAGTDGGLFRYDPAQPRAGFQHVPLSIGGREDRLAQVWAFAAMKDGALWIGTKYGLVRRDPTGRMTYRTLLISATDVVNALVADADGTLWIGHEAGLFRLDRAGAAVRYTIADGLPYNEVRSLHRSTSGTLWIGTSRGLAALDGGQFRTFPRAQGLSHAFVNALTEDAAGNLWIATQRGAMRWSRSGFVTYNEADGLPHDNIAAVFIDDGGRMYVVSPNWFISRFDGTRFLPTRPNLPGQTADTPWRQARGVLRDRAGEWWIPAAATLYRFAAVPDIGALAQARPKAVYTARDGLPGDDIRYTFEDSRGDIWMADFAPARTPVTRFVRASGTFERYSDAHGLPPFNSVVSFAEDAGGGVWMGLREGGIARYAAGRFKVFGAGDALPPGTVGALHVDRAGSLWIAVSGPYGGIARIANPADASPRLERVPAFEAAGQNSAVSLIIEDATGRIYAATARGLTVLDAQTGRTMEYTTVQGLATSVIAAGVRDRRGGLWIGTAYGLSRFDPVPIPAAPVPNVLIVGLAAAGTPLPISDLGAAAVGPIELTATENDVRIDFVGLAPGTGHALRYQYRLDDADWSAPTSTRSVTYAKLPPGRFRFSVRAISGEGGVSLSPASVAFTIVPPFWQRWWFLTLSGLAVAGAIAAGYRYRVRRLIALERVRTRIASDLHDDLGSSLSQIAILSEVASRHIGAQRPAVTAPLGRIADLSRESLDAMGDIVWAIDPQKDRVANLTQRMRRFAEDLAGARGIALEFDAEGDADRDLPLAAEVRREVFLVFKEAVKNAARHSGCRRVAVVLRLRRGLVTLSVSDDGRGFDPAAPGDGHGLNSLRRRAAALRGTLAVDSAPGAGTRVVLSVPATPRG